MNRTLIKKAFEDEKNCIVFSSDASYIPLTSVAIQSIIETSDPSNRYDIIIIHCGLSNKLQKTVVKMADDYEHISIRFHDISNIFGGKNFYTANRECFSESAYYRLAIPYVLENGYSKAVYLDSDMIVQSDLYNIFYTDIGNNLIGAIKDYWGICNCYIPEDPRRAYRESIGLTDIDSYVISSTLLFNLQLFRDTYSLDYILNLSSGYNWLQHDQDVLNVLCTGAICYLSPKWGFMTDYGNNHYLPKYLQNDLKVVAHPIIFHYGGRRKPTTSAYVDNDIAFWRVAQNTPYFTFLMNGIKSLEYRTYIAKLLFPEKIKHFNTDKGEIRYCEGIFLDEVSSGHTKYRDISIRNNQLHLEGIVAFFGVDSDSKIKFEFEINKVRYLVNCHYRDDGYFHKRKITTYRAEAFIFDFELNREISDYYEIALIAILDGEEYLKENLSFDKFSTINGTLKNSYYSHNNWLITTNNKILKVQYATNDEISQCEMNLQKELKGNSGVAERKAAIVRKIYNIVKHFKRKPIWLVSDRVGQADENGEAFFIFLNKEKKSEVNSFFIINKNSTDYKRLKKIGKVIPVYSYRHKLLHLLADVLVSSQTDSVWRNPFRRYDSLYGDIIYDKPFIFLQHGIISNDLSRWFSRKEQNLAGFITSTEKEYNSIINGKYNYTSDEVWLTGLPRFDLLQSNPHKVITVMPTWRLYLTTGQNPKTGEWNLKNDFANSEYVTFYRNLMNHERLNKECSRLGYTLQFKLHPAFCSYAKEFQFNENVQVISGDKSYRQIYSESNLVITDYSSAIYDFIYLRKPIIYTQFDYETFFSGQHSYDKGDMDYESDGFGEVEYTLEDTVDRIIEYIENGCLLKDKYQKRIDNFFAFNDHNNCQRIYKRIIKLQTNRK